LQHDRALDLFRDLNNFIRSNVHSFRDWIGVNMTG
jgi:hypothetical protein